MKIPQSHLIAKNLLKMFRSKYWLFLPGLFFCVQLLIAQEFTGRVSDQTGAIVTKAIVKVQNQNTNEEVSTQTSTSGFYTVPYLKPGDYTVTVSAPGFTTYVKSNITLEASKTAVINFSLKVGSVDTSITVNSDEALLDFGKADYGELVENTRVTELPLNGGDPGMLAILNAGTNWTGDIKYQRPFDDTQANLSVNGGGAGNVALMLDGVPNSSSSTNNTGSAQIGYVTPISATQEFKIITNPYDAQYGLMAGGVEDVILKSGSNKIHGSVYEYARRTWLDANTWSNDWYISKATAGTDVTSYKTSQMKWDQYGAELDGPVIIPKIYNGKNKTFFTLQYEKFNETEPNTITESVPSPQWKTGDFSNLVYWTGSEYDPMAIMDPQSVYKNSGGTWKRHQFGPNDSVQQTSTNVIPSSRINTMAQKILDLYPDPNTTTATGSNPFANNYTVSSPNTDRYRNVLIKLDHLISDRNRLSVHYGYWERVEKQSYTACCGAAERGMLPHGERSHTFTLEDTHTITPNLIADFRTNATVRADYTYYGASYDPTQLGWTNDQVSEMGVAAATEFPMIALSEFAYLGNNDNEETVKNSLSMLPSITWIHGAHTVHFGLDGRWMQTIGHKVSGGNYFWVDRMWTQTNVTGSWDSASGNSIAAFLLGNPSSGDDYIGTQTIWSQHYYAPFVQDDWKITPKLTLNIGVRWDFLPAPTERHNYGDYAFNTDAVNPINNSVSISGVNEIKGGISFLGVDGNPRGPYKTGRHNIQPRIGMAYALNDSTVLRAGFGESFRNPQNGPNTLGYSATTTYQEYDSSYTKDVFPNLNHQIDNPYSAVTKPSGSSKGLETDLGNGPWDLNPHYQIPSFWNYSVGIEHQFNRNDTVNVSYVGSRLYNGDSSDNLNRTSLSMRENCNPQLGGRLEPCQNDTVNTPFEGISAFSGSNYYTDSSITNLNLSRSYPEFGDVIRYQLNDYRTWYNSLQVTETHRYTKGLTVHATWTWSKMMEAGGYKDQDYRVELRKIDSNDYTHRVTLSGVYTLPIGQGKLLLPNSGHILNSAIGGWELGAMYIYHTGAPWSVPDSYNLSGNAYVKPHIQKDDNYIRLVAACADQYVENSDNKYVLKDLSFDYDGTCKNGANFHAVPTYGKTSNTVYTGIRLPHVHQFDANLSKDFKLYADMKLQIRLSAFNVLNHPLWSENPDNSPQDSTFGLITRGPSGQSNLPREMQLTAKIVW